MLGWYPGLRKMQKVNFIEVQRPKDKENFCLAKFIKGKRQAHLEKYLKLMLVEMLGWYPGLRKMQNVNFIEVQRPKDKREFLPLNSSSSAT